MTIHVIAVGKLKEEYLKDAQKEYLKRLSRFCKVEVVEIDEEKAPDNASCLQEEKVRQKEAERIRKALTKGTYVISLALDGQQLTSEGLAGQLQSLMLEGKSDISFIIGGSTGLDGALMKDSDCKLCLSRMTFPHQLARIILLEQVYRGYKIINHETYHK
ncbi:MAG: 23S rRNA (pseudouridine(1915)-N(3))-methyltransferase RlmH [Clostridia bacterium]|nr:23S rRNA (pseudouridine(1915)-N(3))-methyltransferase RlmH [Clostridia bacterium]